MSESEGRGGGRGTDAPHSRGEGQFLSGPVVLGEGTFAELQGGREEVVQGAPFRPGVQHQVVSEHVLGHRHKLTLVAPHLLLISRAWEGVGGVVAVGGLPELMCNLPRVLHPVRWQVTEPLGSELTLEVLELHLHDVGRDGGELGQQCRREHILLPLLGSLSATTATQMAAKHI